jgi:hypothetical protein
MKNKTLIFLLVCPFLLQLPKRNTFLMQLGCQKTPAEMKLNKTLLDSAVNFKQ